jgi:hypothetical protein
LSNTERWSDCLLGNLIGVLGSTFAGKTCLFCLVYAKLNMLQRWGYRDINETREQVQNMKAANIPLEGMSVIIAVLLQDMPLTHFAVMWNDIDLYHAFRDFTTDPVSFPGDEVRAFIDELVCNVLFLNDDCSPS